ncbi:MAG: ABC transporter ATP-binding protein [Thermoplasmataceae archaeon]
MLLGSIEIKNLFKRYGNVVALNGITLDIPSGLIYGVIGPNGSGKTTLLKAIAGIIPFDAGQLAVRGIDVGQSPNEVKKILGYVPETPILYESLTPAEFLAFVGSIRGMDHRVLSQRTDTLCKAFGIRDKVNDFIGGLSFGTKQKVAIISALIHDPDVIVMDEGMNGLDPKSSRILKEILTELARRGKSIVVSTHILEVAQQMCDRISILYQGRIVASGDMSGLREMAGTKDADLEDIFLRMTESDNLSSSVDSVLRAMGENES